LGFPAGLVRHEHASRETAFDEPAHRRQVIFMTVGHDHGVGFLQALRGDRRIVIVASPRACFYARIEQQPIAVAFDADTGSSLFPESAMEVDAHLLRAPASSRVPAAE